MGINNRQRRAAKSRARRRAAGESRAQPQAESQAGSQEWNGWIGSEDFRLGAASLALRHLVLCRLDGRAAATDHERFLAFPEDHQRYAVDDQLAYAVGAAVTSGWSSSDLTELGRRRLAADVLAHLLDAVAAPSGQSSRRWAHRHQLPWPQALESMVELLTLLYSLPQIQPVSPPQRGEQHGVDERVLAKVRALLAKAEATEFDEEADALTAKAQQLMTAYSIERTLAEQREPVRPVPVVRRLWLDAPYVDAKATLVNAVANSNRSRCVLSSGLGFVTIIGFATDLDTVELLSTSLLWQATRAMTAVGSHVARNGRSRTRSFRQSFLVAYAGRIGERLRTCATVAEAEADAAHDGRLLPVLAARTGAVDDLAAELFPQLVERSISVSNAAGWGAGRAAADLALFDIRDALAAERAG